MNLEKKILQLLASPGYRPMKRHEIARALNLESREDRSRLRQALNRLEQDGRVEHLRKNRWSLPDADHRMTGTIRIFPKSGSIVIPDQEGEPEIFVAEKNLGTALPGDRVLLDLFHSDFAAKRAGRGPRKPRAEGRVVKVLERANEQVVGLLRKTPYYAYVIPDAPGFRHDVRVEDTQGIDEYHKVLVRLDPWDDPHRPLGGTILEDLGKMDAPGVDVDSLLRDAGIVEEFPAEVVREAAGIPKNAAADHLGGRRDLRDAVIFTIDPETARDYDDALSIEPHPRGGWKVGVHIADVSTFVEPGTLLDKEAFKRGNSIYLVDRAVMMLPKELTTKICSLNPKNDHLSHTVELHISPAGELLDYETYPSVIHSKARLTYGQVQRFIDGNPPAGIPEPVLQRLEKLCPLTQKIRQRRIANGSVEISTPEIEIKLDERGKVAKMTPRSEAKDAYQVVEECMLLANRAVAEILIAAEHPAIYRVHEEPDEEQWAAMGMELQALGIPKLPTTREEINEAIRMAKGTAVEYTANLAILRNFKRAEYSSTQIGHFGLAFDDYTHFTSPIRRYPDLLVHRMLKAVEKGKAHPLSREQIDAIATHCNETERQADELERKSIEGKRMEYYREIMNRSPGAAFKGYIVSIKGRGMIVELPDSLQRGMLPFASIVSDWLEADETMTKAVTRNGKVRFTLGDEVEVALAKVDTARGMIDFVLADQVRPVRKRGKRIKKPAPDLKTGQLRAHKGRRRRRR